MTTQGNILVIHGGAPTAVMNASLYGVLDEAASHPGIGKVLGANGGTGGLLAENLMDLGLLTGPQREQLLGTPGSVIGTSRTPLYEAEYARIAEVIDKYNIRYVLVNGGNGTMDACYNIHLRCAEKGVRVVGIPKTVDNDIAVTDHSPGYGSAARYLAATVSEVCQDVRAMPIHVCVIEAMGRNAGWLTAAASLALDGGIGPDLLYVPELAFNQEQFLADVERLYNRQGGVVVVASEGLHDEANVPIVPPIFRTKRAVYYSDVGAHLANLVVQKLGIKARSEKPGICGRASIAHQSDTDRSEAVLCGQQALKLALEGQTGVMVTLLRKPGSPYRCETGITPIQNVTMVERKLPDEYITPEGNGVTEAFRAWCRPLIGKPLPQYLYLPERQGKDHP